MAAVDPTRMLSKIKIQASVVTTRSSKSKGKASVAAVATMDIGAEVEAGGTTIKGVKTSQEVACRGLEDVIME